MIKTELGYKHDVIFTILQALNKSGHGDPAYYVADAIYQYNCLVDRDIIHERNTDEIKYNPIKEILD